MWPIAASAVLNFSSLMMRERRRRSPDASHRQRRLLRLIMRDQAEQADSARSRAAGQRLECLAELFVDLMWNIAFGQSKQPRHIGRFG
jgi:hypothetical protein